MAPKKVFNFRLDEAVIRFLDDMAARAGFTRSDAVRQSAQAAAGILEGARRQSITRLLALRERFGEDAELTVAVSMANDGTPLGHIDIDGEAPEGVRAVPVVIPGSNKALVVLNIPGLGHVGESVLARFGDEYVFIPEARFPIGELPWPPDSRTALVIHLRDIDRLIEDGLMLNPEPAEA